MAGSESLKPPARLLLVEGPTDKQVVRIRETPGFMGSAVGEDDLEVDGAFVTRFANWLRMLFG